MASTKSNSNPRSVAAVAYYRMSSKKQDKSIPAQRAEVEKFAKANGYKIIRWEPYVDEGISGSESETRGGFSRLIEDATTAGDFGVILVWDQDRFSRFDPMEANFYWYQLRQAGVRIVSVTQGELDWESLGGWLTASVTQHGKAQYLKDLSRNVLRGRLRRAREGKWTGSRVPYGYGLDENRDIVLGDRQVVATIKWIFETYAASEMSLYDMGHELNDQGIPSPGGGIWNTRSFHYVLGRENYVTGRVPQFRESKGKFYSVQGDEIVERTCKGIEISSDDDCHFVECPKIIDKRLWDRCQAVMDTRRTQTAPRGSAGSRSALSGLVICGHCGKPMYASTSPKREKADPGGVRYLCSSYMKHGTRVCNRNGIHEAALLDMLVKQIREKVLDPDELERLREKITQKLASKAGSPDESRISRLQKNLGKLDDDIRAAAKELKRTPDDLYDLAVEDLREIRAKRASVAKRIEAAESRSNPRSSAEAETLDRTLGRLNTLREKLTDANPAVVSRHMRQIVQNVELWFTHTTGQRTHAKFEKGLIRFSLSNSAELNSPASRRCSCPSGM